MTIQEKNSASRSLLLPLLCVFGTMQGSAACDFNAPLDCVPQTDRTLCESFIKGWGPAASEASLRVIDAKSLNQNALHAVVYGCYGRGAFEQSGHSEDSERLMFLSGRPIFPESNPAWNPGEDLIHYRLLDVRDFHGVGPDRSSIAHILFVEQTNTGSSPGRDGGAPHPSGRTLLGFWLQPDAVTEVFHQTTQETLNTRDDLGEGEYSITLSTASYFEKENRMRLETSILREKYLPPSDEIAGKPPVPRKFLERAEEHKVQAFRWDGLRFSTSTR